MAFYAVEDVSIREKSCCFTGHRRIPENETASLKARLRETVEALIRRGYIYFGAGGALGFDMLAAETVLELRRIYPQIRLVLVLPCSDHTARWNPRDVREFERIRAGAFAVTGGEAPYTDGCMLARNRRLVDGSSVCIAYQRKSEGGTAYTTAYARRCGVDVIEL